MHERYCDNAKDGANGRSMLAPSARVAISGHSYRYGVVPKTVATLIAEAGSHPLARSATIGHGYSSGSVTTPIATVIADTRLALWAALRSFAMDITLAHAAIIGHGYTVL